jgi:exodeoxyribonuclease VII large subunit
MKLKTLTVSELNRYVKRLFSTDPVMNAVRVEGEITGYKKHSSGHAYFTIKDAESRIDCVMFSSYLDRIEFAPKDGDFVEIFGRVSIYEKSGRYQLYVTELSSVGLGRLYMAFNELKERLSKEGLFDVDIKIPIPKSIKKMIIITSPTGAAIRDVISVIKRRNPLIELLILPANMQGSNCIEDVSNAFKVAQEINSVDLILLTRGGGSYEELHVFNNENLARTIHECTVPVISAIGHEIDFTIADFVADMRAPTPSAAAELIASDLRGDLTFLHKKIQQNGIMLQHKITIIEQRLSQFNPTSMLFPIEKRLSEYALVLDDFNKYKSNALVTHIETTQLKFDSLMTAINARNPLNLLNKGYAHIQLPTGENLDSVKQLEIGDSVISRLKDGSFVAEVKKVEVYDE